jgi:hypothetical protein
MTRLGTLLLVLGLLIANVGTGRFFLAVGLHPPAQPAPATNQMLMWVSWGAGAVVAATGALMILFRRAAPDTSRQQYWTY